MFGQLSLSKGRREGGSWEKSPPTPTPTPAGGVYVLGSLFLPQRLLCVPPSESDSRGGKEGSLMAFPRRLRLM